MHLDFNHFVILFPDLYQSKSQENCLQLQVLQCSLLHCMNFFVCFILHTLQKYETALLLHFIIQPNFQKDIHMCLRNYSLCRANPFRHKQIKGVEIKICTQLLLINQIQPIIQSETIQIKRNMSPLLKIRNFVRIG